MRKLPESNEVKTITFKNLGHEPVREFRAYNVFLFLGSVWGTKASEETRTNGRGYHHKAGNLTAFSHTICGNKSQRLDLIVKKETSNSKN